MGSTFLAGNDSAAASTTRHSAGWFPGMCFSTVKAFSARSLRRPPRQAREERAKRGNLPRPGVRNRHAGGGRGGA